MRRKMLFVGTVLEWNVAGRMRVLFSRRVIWLHQDDVSRQSKTRCKSRNP